MPKQQRRKHNPQRTCVICRGTHPKRELTRIVRTADDGVQVDPTGKLAGRGAYLCSSPRCWGKALESAALGRALRVSLTEEERRRISESQPIEGEASDYA